MKIIKKLACMIEEEVHDAEEYARCAVMHKEDRPQLARTFAQLAEEELAHADRLHTHVVQLIDEYRRQSGEPPAAMQAVYDYLHERNIGHVEDVRGLLRMSN